MFLVSIGLSSTLSFLLKSPLLSGICTPKRQTLCPSSRPLLDQTWDFPGIFREIFVTNFREVSGQFSGRHSGTPNTTNKGVWRFLTVSRTIFRKTFRSVFRSTSGRTLTVQSLLFCQKKRGFQKKSKETSLKSKRRAPRRRLWRRVGSCRGLAVAGL